MPDNHQDVANFIWGICNLLRGPYRRNEYRKVILPLTVLRRFDCILSDTQDDVFAEHEKFKSKPQSVIEFKLRQVTGRPFYNTSKLTFERLLDDSNQIAPNLISYVNAFSENVREIMDRFAFDQQIAKMAEKNLLFEVIKAFTDPKLDLSEAAIDDLQMGYIFEELIRIGAEQSNEEAGEHFTPREVIKLMVNLLLTGEDITASHVVKTIYDPACGTGGMLSVAERWILKHNIEAAPKLYGQDWNDEAWAVCKSDMLIKGNEADNIVLGDTFISDGYETDDAGNPWTFDYMLANPPFGVEWKQQKETIDRERNEKAYDGRFGAGLPRINDASLLFLQHMISKRRSLEDGGTRLAIVFNGSPLFTGDAGSGESEIRRWIIENDWLEAVVALPDQLFYNTGIFTYIWIVTNRKPLERKGKVQLINAVHFFQKMRKSLNNKRNEISEDQIVEITQIYADFLHDAVAPAGSLSSVNVGKNGSPPVVSKVFDNEDFGFHKITVERPLKLNFATTPDRMERLRDSKTFQQIAKSKKKAGSVAAKGEIAAGLELQERIVKALEGLNDMLYRSRPAFLEDLDMVCEANDVRLAANVKKAILAALSERDESAEVCRDSKGKPEPDPDLRDYESVPLKDDIAEYFQREVLPHVPDAWIDESKTKVGYEIPLNRHFYEYRPPRPLVAIKSDIAELETEIVQMLREVVG